VLVRDTLHGDIDLEPIETAVLDSPVVQRMRGIKQLGAAYFVYPGAVHTRFEHSLGTCFTAHRIIAAIRHSGVAVDQEIESAVGVAALLHDITHVPFGHTLEDERRLFPRHDKGDRFETLLARGLADTLDGLGIRDAVVSILTGGDTTPRWASDVVSSTIDADLLDYLRRDSLYTGLAQNYDERVFRYFTVADDRLVLDMNKHGMTRPDAWSEIVQLLRMRYFLTERVYYHHTKVAAGAMISKAVELALAAEQLTENDLLDLNDWSLFSHLRDLGNPEIGALIDRLEQRRLYKRAYVLSAAALGADERSRMVDRYHHDRESRESAERRLAATAGASANEVIVYCPALTLMKEAGAMISTPDGVREMTGIPGSATSEITALAQRHAALWRVYVFAPADRVPAVSAAATELFGRASEHRSTAAQ